MEGQQLRMTDLPENSTQEPRCVYCGSKGPFTDEHILARAFAAVTGAQDNP